MMFDTYYLGKEGFVWFLGVVEDRKDPEELGRVRVRCFGYHTDSKELIPTNSLPWAHIVQPPNLPASYTCKEGELVVGFFLDAYSAQQPVVLGVIPGKPQKPISYDRGFTDPNQKYPVNPGESTFSRLSRGGKYPKNYVHETEIGHTFELDDNEPGRIKLAHVNGTYVEFDESGNRICVVRKDNKVTISGDNKVSIGGDCTISVGGDCTFEVGGKFSVSAADISLSASGAIDMTAADINESASGSMNMSAGASLKAGSTGTTSISGGTTTVSAASVLEFPAPLVGVQEGTPDSPDSASGSAGGAAGGDAIDGGGLEEVTVTSQKIEVPDEGGLIGGLNKVIDKVGKGIQYVNDEINKVISDVTTPLFKELGSIAKELEPLTKFADSLGNTMSQIVTLGTELEEKIQPIETLVGKELFPRTDFYKFENLTSNVNSFSEQVSLLSDPLKILNDKTVDLNLEVNSRIVQSRTFNKALGVISGIDQLNQSVHELNSFFNLSTSKDKRVPSLSERLRAVLGNASMIKTDYDEIDEYNYFFRDEEEIG